MSTLNTGDKVKFLNASGGGIVTRVIDSRMVVVMTGDGFEIPTLISELVKIEPDIPAARFFDEHFKVVPASHKQAEEEPGDDRLQPLPVFSHTERRPEDVYLAFVPHDQKWLITGQIDVMIINNSSYDLLYNIFGKTPTGHYTGMDYGSIFPDSRVVVQTINREQLVHWTEGCMQFLFHRDQCADIVPPVNSEFKIEGRKFYKEGNYREHRLIQARGIVVRVVSLEGITGQGKSEASDHVKAREEGREAVSCIARHKVAPGEAVVDLHIHELLEDTSNLEKSDLLEFQKNYFLKCLDGAVMERYGKVTFIHGKGNGILRAALLELLKEREGLEFFDAPLALYGGGALEIRIPGNPEY